MVYCDVWWSEWHFGGGEERERAREDGEEELHKMVCVDSSSTVLLLLPLPRYILTPFLTALAQELVSPSRRSSPPAPRSTLLLPWVQALATLSPLPFALRALSLLPLA